MKNTSSPSLSMTPLYFRTDVNSLLLDLNILCDMQQTGILMGVLNIGHDTICYTHLAFEHHTF